MSYLDFTDISHKATGRLTKTWMVNSASNGSLLGAITYRPTWRKYVFQTKEADFDVNCLEEIVQFLKDHKEDRNV